MVGIIAQLKLSFLSLNGFAMYEIVIVLLLLVSVAIVALILVQQGKGAGMGASFGAGASNTVFGAVGSGNFLTRSTWILAVVFFAICLFIGYLQKNQDVKTGDFTNIGDSETQVVEQQASPEDVPALDSDVPFDESAPINNVAPEVSDVPAEDGASAAAATDSTATDNAATDNAIVSGDNSAADSTAADATSTEATTENTTAVQAGVLELSATTAEPESDAATENADAAAENADATAAEASAAK